MKFTITSFFFVSLVGPFIHSFCKKSGYIHERRSVVSICPMGNQVFSPSDRIISHPKSKNLKSITQSLKDYRSINKFTLSMLT